MTTRKGGLGKGLDSLIPEKKTTSNGSTNIDINKVEPNREQPRKNFDKKALEELAASIKQVGIITPLVVQKQKDYYEIIAGERRWRAAKLAGLKEVPVVIRNYTDEQKAEVALIENIQREDLNPIEEALAYKRLLEEYGLKQEEVAEKVSKSRTAITNSLRLLKLDERVQKMVVNDELSTGHARAIVAAQNGEQQYRLAIRVATNNLSVRQTEALIRGLKDKKQPATRKKAEKSIYVRDMETKLCEALGTKVTLNEKDSHTGIFEIHYYSEDDLERLYEQLLSGK